MKRLKFLLRWILYAGLAVFIYYFFVYPLFIYPVYVASQPTNSRWELIFGGLVYAYVFLVIVEHILTIAANLYGFKKYRLFSWIFPKGSRLYNAQIEGSKGFRGTAGAIAGSYLSFIFWYTLNYLYLGTHFQELFDAKTVTFWDALYLSFTAISVGPAGMNPTSAFTKCLVMTEVAIGLFYAVLVFSVLADWIKRRNEPTIP